MGTILLFLFSHIFNCQICKINYKDASTKMGFERCAFKKWVSCYYNLINLETQFDKSALKKTMVPYHAICNEMTMNQMLF